LKDLKLHPRSSRRFFCFVILAALALGQAVTPVRALAQDATPPETSAPATSDSATPTAAPKDSGPSEPEQSEEEKQVQQFRLEGPVVKWTAKTFNLSIEKTADIYEILNFLIIALAVGMPLFRFLPRFLRNRKEKLRSDLEQARKVTEDANSRLSAVEAKLASLGDEIHKFRAEVEAEALQDEARIKASIGEESARIVEAAEQEIGQAAAQARRGLRSFAADLAIDKAAKKLVLTAETDRALIAEFVGDVVGKGGKK
jgi:F-type H+-transporting ATPase subunit b